MRTWRSLTRDETHVRHAARVYISDLDKIAFTVTGIGVLFDLKYCVFLAGCIQALDIVSARCKACIDTVFVCFDTHNICR